jgi:glutamine synthetase
LKEALDEMEKCELIKETLGEHIFNKFLEMKRLEWKDFSITVTEWERQRYEII